MTPSSSCLSPSFFVFSDLPPDPLKDKFTDVQTSTFYCVHVDFEPPGTKHTSFNKTKLMYAGYYMTLEAAEEVNNFIIDTFSSLEGNLCFHTKIVSCTGSYALFPDKGYYSIFAGRSTHIVEDTDGDELLRVRLTVDAKVKEWAPDFWCKLQSDSTAI